MLSQRFAGALRFLPLLVLTAACLAIEEQYPFSHFPMYSRFGASTYYVYLADDQDRPLSSYATVGLSTATLKKMYDTELGREAKRLKTKRARLPIESKRAAAERVLSHFRRSAAAGAIAPLPEALRLYEVQLRLADKAVGKQTALVGESR